MRRAFILVALLAAGCGEARQDADEPSGEFKVEIADASFPATQHVAEDVELKVRVRNGEAEERLRNVAVTVETAPRGEEDSALAFGQNVRDAGLSDAGRPIWVLDAGPAGADTVAVNTWSAGALAPGQEKELTWKLVASRAGTYEVSYRVSPGMTGRARPAAGRTSGTFTVVIEDEPVPARVGEDGEVERGGF
jgi:N-acetylmuramoyl-L-alanine amidase